MELPTLVRFFNPFLSFLLCKILITEGLAQAYPTPVDFDGKINGWKITPDSPTIRYKVYADSEDDLDLFLPIIEEAKDLWSSVPLSVINLEAAAADEESQIAINLKKSIQNSAYAAAYTEIDAYLENGSYGHCSIYIQISDNVSIYSTGKAILHELGHCLGLSHSLIPQAIMSYELTKNSFALDIDDEAALSRLYPLDGKAKLAPGCACLPIAVPQLIWIMLPLLAIGKFQRKKGGIPLF